jgi:hypothetical protein
MNDYTKDEPINIGDQYICSNADPMIACPINDSEGNADYSYIINSWLGVQNIDWKYANDDNDPECDRNWARIHHDGSIHINNVPITNGKDKFCKKKVKYSKNQLMKAWNRAGCISAFPIGANTSSWQALGSISDVELNMKSNYRNSDNADRLKDCFGIPFIKAGNSMAANTQLKSQNGLYELRMQNDGNLCVWKTEGVSFDFVWRTMDKLEDNMKGGRLSMQTDGNLVLYRSNNVPYWASGTSGGGNGKNYILVMENDGAISIYDTTTNDFTRVWTRSREPIKATITSAFLTSNGQDYNKIKNIGVKNLNAAVQELKIKKDNEINNYLNTPNDQFDPNNKLNSEDRLFAVLLHKNLMNCDNKPLDDTHCSSYYTNANKNINNMISTTYFTK